MIQAGVGVSEDTFLVDDDGDGVVDRIEDESGRVGTEHAVGDTEFFVLVDRETGNQAVFDAKTGQAAPLVPVAEEVTQVTVLAPEDRMPLPASGGPDDAAAGEVPVPEVVEQVAVTVPKATGWIKVSIPDPAPGKPVGGLVRSDGLVLSTDQVWRSEGKVHFIDDPEVTYVLSFTPSAESGPAVGWQGLVALALLGVPAVALVVIRFRRL